MAGADTKKVIDELYDAYLAGDPAGMLATFSDDIAFRFLAQVDARGIEEARRFFTYSATKLVDLDFRIERKIVDGAYAAVLWSETATTPGGEPWENHGVDVFEVRDGKIVTLHENNDVRLVYQHFEPYDPGGANEAAGE